MTDPTAVQVDTHLHREKSCVFWGFKNFKSVLMILMVVYVQCVIGRLFHLGFWHVENNNNHIDLKKKTVINA